MVLSCVAAKSEKKKRKRKKLKKSSDAYDYDDLEGNPATEPAKTSKQPVCIINLKAKTFVHKNFLQLAVYLIDRNCNRFNCEQDIRVFSKYCLHRVCKYIMICFNWVQVSLRPTRCLSW